MFLTGQLFPKPWDEPERKVTNVKKHGYSTVNDGTFKMIAKPDTTEIDQDNQIMQMDEREQEQLRRTVLQRMRYQSFERINNRKLEREVLQFKSKQALNSIDTNEEMEAIANNDPVLFEELSMRRSKSFKDPSRPITATVTDWNQDPTMYLSNLPGLKYCKWIADKAKVMDVVDEMENMWKEQNRQKIRQKLIEQHEKNIKKEEKAGVFKDYRTLTEQSQRAIVPRSRPLTTANLIRNRRLMHNNNQNTLTNFNGQRKVATAISEKPEGYKEEIFSQQNGESRIISKQSERVTTYDTHQPHNQMEDTKTIDNKNIEQADDISSTNEQKEDQMEPQDIVMDPMSDVEEYQDQMPSPQMDFYEDPMNRDNQGPSRQQVSEFRVSFSKPKFPTVKTASQNLYAKKPFKVNNPFLYSDCAGLVDPKHITEAKQQSTTGNFYMSQSDGGRLWTPQEAGSSVASQSMRGRNKHSNHVNEIFPFPEFNSYMSKPTRKKDRSRINKPHSAMRHLRGGTAQASRSTFQAQPNGLNGNANMQFSASVNLPDNKPPNDDQFRSTMSSMTRKTHHSQVRKFRQKHFEEEQREIQEIQESMKQLDDFDQRYGSVKSKVGYPKVALKSDLKKIYN